VAKEQKRIEKQITDFEKNIWTTPVDSAELARQDSIEAANTKSSKRSRKTSTSTRTSRRGSSETTVEKKETSKSSSGSSAPRVSVRRQRR
jgi:hypothetical protein